MLCCSADTGRDRSIAERMEILAINYQDRISIEPGKRGGKPCIRGMRITVYDVLEYLASGMSEQEILDDFPDLTPEEFVPASLLLPIASANWYRPLTHEAPL